MPAPLVLPAPSPPAPTSTQGSTFTSAGLQKSIGKQSLLNQVPLGTRIHQDIHNRFFLSTSYSHLQLQLPFVSMWSIDNSHGMQL